MTRFRIYTEAEANIAEIVHVWFAGFTLFQGIGFWEGNREYCTVVEIITEDRQKVYDVARIILRRNNQEAILVTEEEIRGEFITRKEAVA